MNQVQRVEQELEHYLEEAQGKTSQELRQIIADGLRLNRDNLLRMAAAVNKLESRGETIEGNRFFIDVLRRIGNKTLLVDLWLKLGDRQYTIGILKNKPVEEQSRVLEMSDPEINNLFRKDKPKEPEPAKRRPDRGVPDWSEIAENADPRDIAEMCAALVEKCSRPKEAARAVKKEMDRILRTRQSA